MILRVVVLPAPLGPTKPWSDFGATWKVIPSRARCCLNRWVTFSTLMTGGVDMRKATEVKGSPKAVRLDATARWNWVQTTGLNVEMHSSDQRETGGLERPLSTKPLSEACRMS